MESIATGIAGFHDPLRTVKTIHPRTRGRFEQVRPSERAIESAALVASQHARLAPHFEVLAIQRHPFRSDEIPCVAATVDAHAERPVERTYPEESIDRRARGAGKRWFAEARQVRGVPMEPIILLAGV